MRVGDRVEVHNRFTGSWSGGFVVDEVAGAGYRLRRLSDGSMLPGITGHDDLRPVSVHSAWGRRG